MTFTTANYDHAAYLALKYAQTQRRRNWLIKTHSTRPKCAYCYRVTILQNPPVDDLAATVDHFMPLALKGRDNPVNWRLACHQCNWTKGDLHPKEWLALLDG